LLGGCGWDHMLVAPAIAGSDNDDEGGGGGGCGGARRGEWRRGKRAGVHCGGKKRGR